MNHELIEAYQSQRVEALRREAQIANWLDSKKSVRLNLALLFFKFAQWLEPQLKGHHAAN